MSGGIANLKCGQVSSRRAGSIPARRRTRLGCAHFMSEPTAQPQPQNASSFTWGVRTYVLAVLLLTYIVNVMDRGVLSLLLQSISKEFQLTDFQLGILAGIPFAVCYSTLGIPIATIADRTNRRGVLAICCAVWSLATAGCGLAFNFISLVIGRALTAVGEAGGTPPSHSLISDFFSREERATALSIYALGVPIGTMAGNLLGGWGNHFFGWRAAFMLIGLPGLLVAGLVWFTVREPRRGQSELGAPKTGDAAAPPLLEVVRFLAGYPSFRHMCLAAGLHSVVWYAGSTLNAVFFQRSHGMSSGEAGTWLALFAGVGALGTLIGGVLSDRLSARTGDRRWYMWVPGIATLVMVPFQFYAYLSNDLSIVIPSFFVMVSLASFFFGPSFAVTQTLATLRSRAVATSLLLLVQTFVGLGLGPLVAGRISQWLRPNVGDDSFRYGLCIVGIANLWAAYHYFAGARSFRQDFANTERLNRAALTT
jgi:MFS family permease